MENKRNFFRVDIYGTPVTVLVTRENERKTYEATLRDLSGSGISFYMNKSIILEEGEIQWIDFSLEGDAFQSEIKVLRAQESSNMMLYACEFLGMNDRESAKISSVLLKYDAIRRK